MTTIKELRSRREHKLAQAREIHERAGSTIPARKFTDAEQSDYDALMSEVKSIGVEIETELDKPTETEERDEIRTRNTSREWKDASGNPLRVIRSNERLSDGRISRENDGFDIGRAIKGVVLGHWDADSEREKRVMTVGIDSAGGYTIEPTIASTVIDLVRSSSVCIASGMQTLEMPSHTVDLVRVTDDPSVDWYGEGATIANDTTAALGRLSLRSSKLAVKIAISRELIEDSPNGADIIRKMVVDAMAAEIDRVCLIGDGDAGEPVGLGTNADVIASQTGVASPTWDDFIAAQTLISTQNHEPNAAIIHPATRGALAILKASTGGSYLIKPPLLDSIKMFTTTSIANSQAFVGDFTQLMLGIRTGLQLNAIISHDTLATDTIELLARFRGDVGILRPTAFSHLSGISY